VLIRHRLLIVKPGSASFNPSAHPNKVLFGLCKGEMSMEEMDIVDGIFTDPGGVRRQPGALNR